MFWSVSGDSKVSREAATMTSVASFECVHIVVRDGVVDIVDVEEVFPM